MRNAVNGGGCRYDLERSNGTDRFHFDAVISPKDMLEYYLPPFKACVEQAQPASVMCSLNGQQRL